MRADLLVLWGVRNRPAIEGQIRRGGEVCVLERGYLGDRFAWTSVSFGGGLNGRAEFRGVSSDPERLERHFPGMLQPWTHRDGYALLIGQVPGDMSLASVDGNLLGWYEAAWKALDARGYDVRFRPHPVAVQRSRKLAAPAGIPTIGGTLSEAVAGAAVVVTFNSNAGVEAVFAGTPTIAVDCGSMAWPVTAHALDAEPERPDRTAWAAELAWKQWRLDELASGECWERVRSS